MKIDWMLTILAVAAVLIAFSIWRAHRTSTNTFDAFDLIMEEGKASKVALGFMLVLAVSTWVVIAQQISGKLSEGVFGLWLGAWVAPLVAKVVFNKPDAAGTTITTKIESTEKTTP